MSSNTEYTDRLFEPVEVGGVKLEHRVVLAPLTRTRADSQFIPGDLMAEYYTQRASVPGTLLITEAVTIAPEAVGRPYVPAIFNNEQINGWKKVSSH
jgi:NADPH2 dehydrogenase